MPPELVRVCGLHRVYQVIGVTVAASFQDHARILPPAPRHVNGEFFGLTDRLAAAMSIDMSTLSTISVATAGKALNVTPGRIRQICQQHDIGYKLNTRVRLLSIQDLAKLRRIHAGMRKFRKPEK